MFLKKGFVRLVINQYEKKNKKKKFEIYDEKSWENINEYKIRNIKDKHVAVFTYKLLNNILCNNAYVCKWKKRYIKSVCTLAVSK